MDGSPDHQSVSARQNTSLLTRICYLQERNLRLFFAGQVGSKEWQKNDGRSDATD